MSKRTNFSSGAIWENTVGYSRAVRVGSMLEVAGTTAVKDGKVLHLGDPYLQTKAVIEIAKNAIEKAGGSLEDVIRTRMFVKDISHWEEIGKAHGEYFKLIKPVTTLVEVSNFVHPDMLVEIEFSAYLTKN